MTPKENNIAQTLLSRAHSPVSAARIYTEKVVQRPLHLKSTSTTPQSQVQRRLERERKLAARKKKQKPRPLSSRQKRALCLYEIPRSSQKYSIYVPLHEMWLGYIREVLGMDERGHGEDGKEIKVTGAMAAKLCAADYHGAEFEVVRSRCVSRVGVRGIVVKDSKFVFEFVTRTDVVKIVPKEHTVFRFAIPRSKKLVEGQGENGKDSTGNSEVQEEKVKEEGKRDLVFELHGDQFIYRAVDRANKKFKTHFLPDL